MLKAIKKCSKVLCITIFLILAQATLILFTSAQLMGELAVVSISKVSYNL